MRIMYVEDNAINLGLVRRIAKMGNHEVISHANGPDALKALETEEVDLILMDIELEGEMDGIEVVKRLRARGDNRPIVAVTAYAMVGDKDRILAAGCNGYLPKPLPVAQFLQILAKYDPIHLAKSTQEIKAVTPPAPKPAKPAEAMTEATSEAKPAPAKTEPVAETKAEQTPPPSEAVATPAKVESTPAETKTATQPEAKTETKTEASEASPADQKTDSKPAAVEAKADQSTSTEASTPEVTPAPTETASTAADATPSAQSSTASSEASTEAKVSSEKKAEKPSKETMPPEK